MAYKIIWEDTGAQFVFNKEFSNEDLLKSNQEFALDTRFPSAKYAMYNTIDVQEFPVESEVIKEIAAMDVGLFKINPGMKFAIVADQLVMVGLTNVYKTYFELAGDGKTWEIRMFDNEDDARKWINS